MSKKHSIIEIRNCQIKSIEKARIVCKMLDTLEKEIGIGRVEIAFKDNFICPDIDLLELYNSPDPMEKLIGCLLIRLDQIQYGKRSRYKKIR